VNATAYTAVDKAEKEAPVANAINGTAPGVLAKAARKIGGVLIHFSTDYVFDGLKGFPYLEIDEPNPIGVYGRSKLAGEREVQAAGGAYLILRTSWVYSLRRDSFVTKVLEWARSQTLLRIVDDQVSNPTWCRMLAEITAQLIARSSSDPHGWFGERSGIYHLAGSGFASRLEWAREILAFNPKKDEQVVEELLPAKTNEFPTPARRPLFSALNCELFNETFGLRLPDWKDALKLAMEEYQGA
jgi:dTDP-4-dehydrorhamnose reductase